MLLKESKEGYSAVTGGKKKRNAKLCVIISKNKN